MVEQRMSVVERNLDEKKEDTFLGKALGFVISIIFIPLFYILTTIAIGNRVVSSFDKWGLVIVALYTIVFGFVILKIANKTKNKGVRKAVATIVILLSIAFWKLLSFYLG